MTLLELLAVKVGKAVSITLVKLWLKDSEFGQNIALSIVDILDGKVADFRLRKKLSRQFDEIADDIGERLLPIVEAEAGQIAENEINSSIAAVGDILVMTPLNNDVFLNYNLDPFELQNYLLKSNPDASRDLNKKGRALFSRLLTEVSNYLIEISTTLPDFQKAVIRDQLRRDNLIVELTRQVLDRIPPMISADESEDSQRFKSQYCREVARKLDRLELYGMDGSSVSSRYNLTISYISMSTTDELESTEDTLANAERVEDALNLHDRVLIVGDAGTGKTTLLQWLAVRAARKDFEGPLKSWNELTPFFIQLRHIRNRFPRPEEFCDQIAGSIAGTMPLGWVHNQLGPVLSVESEKKGTRKSKDKPPKTLILIDGLDELVEGKRDDFFKWLIDDLISKYRCKVIITSRPAAVTKEWATNFAVQRMLPMSKGDTESLIDKWHEAIGKDLQDESDLQRLDGFRSTLKYELRASSSLAQLATSPLMCALLCAMNRSRGGNVPKDRMELYETATILLLERDTSRGITSDDTVQLSLKDKRELVQDYAYWLLRNGKVDSTFKEFEHQVNSTLKSLPSVKGSSEKIAKLVVQRSGLLREPVKGYVDFVHKTFQEYLGAKSAVGQNDVHYLVDRVGQGTWDEVLIFAAGHSNMDQRNFLISQLLRDDSQERRLLAIACMETMSKVPDTAREQIEKTLRELGAPRTLKSAREMAAAGHAATRCFSGYAGQDETIVAACIHGLALVGTRDAMETIKEYSQDHRELPMAELVRAWDAFDQKVFGFEVISNSDYSGELQWDNRVSLEGLEFATGITRFRCRMAGKLLNLDPINSLVNLNSLDLQSCVNIVDLQPLSSLVELKRLNLNSCFKINDISPLANLLNLEHLEMSSCIAVSDLSPLSKLENLKHLDISMCRSIKNIEALRNLKSLEKLDVWGCNDEVDWSPLNDIKKYCDVVESE